MIDVVIDDDAWRADAIDWRDWANSCYRAAAQSVSALSGEASLLLTNDEAMRELNRRFRDVDKATNVLAFPGPNVQGSAFLGDIAIARETCLREAGEKDFAIRDYVAHMIIHGLAHLIGYDHHTDQDAQAMEECEALILRRLGVKNPYADAMEIKE